MVDEEAKDAGILRLMEELRGTNWYKAASTHVQRLQVRGATKQASKCSRRRREENAWR